jgi:cell division protein FtsW
MKRFPSSGPLATPPSFDYVMLVLVVGLVGFGLVMLFSASYAFAYWAKGNPLYFFQRQLVWVGLGSVALLILLNVDYRIWNELALPILGLTVVALFLVLVAGSDRFGARRQLLGGGSIQPSEVAKLTFTIYVAAWLSSKGERLRRVNYGVVPFAVLLGLVIGLLLLQPDIDTSLIITVTAVAMFFVAGADLIQMGLIGLLSGLTFGGAILVFDYAQKRFRVFWEVITNPFQAQDFHVQQVVAALMAGGIQGRGLTEGEYKLPPGLPTVHSDSIFAVVGEELGLVGTLLVLSLFLLFAYRGVRIALRAPDAFGTLLAFGITTWLALQALINIAMITATIPIAGLVLPFFSYGGSSMVANLAAIGILLNISRGGGGLVVDASSRFRGWNRWTRVPPSDGRRSVGGAVADVRVNRFARSFFGFHRRSRSS